MLVIVYLEFLKFFIFFIFSSLSSFLHSFGCSYYLVDFGLAHLESGRSGENSRLNVTFSL